MLCNLPGYGGNNENNRVEGALYERHLAESAFTSNQITHAACGLYSIPFI